MKNTMKNLAWLGVGAAFGVGASVALREATRAPLAPITLDLSLPPPPGAAGTPEPSPPSPAPPPRPPAFDFFGFEVPGPESAAAPAATLERFELMKDRCAAGFDATSTLHDFRGWTKSVRGSIQFEKDRLEETAAALVSVDARTLDTNNPDRDREMHADFLNSDKYPEFRFELKEFRRTSAGSCRMKGTLEIRGVAREVEMSGVFEPREDGYLRVKGELRTKMSDFGISPPVTALVIRVDDEIRIWFEIWARRGEGKP